MLATQVSYWGIQENKRHNQAMERQAVKELGETTRHNLASEQELTRHNTRTEDETVRHNMAWEAENQRHNLQSESISWGQLEESKRHNKAQESIGRVDNLVDYWRASNDYQIGTRSLSQKDTELEIKETLAENDKAKADAAKSQATSARINAWSNAILGAWRNANGTLEIITGQLKGVTNK